MFLFVIFSSSNVSKDSNDYSIPAQPLATEWPPASKKPRTVGIVEPRVVVKIPWTKIGIKTSTNNEENSIRKLTPPANYVSTLPTVKMVQIANRSLIQNVPELKVQPSNEVRFL